jgi:RNA polymerase sigma-70 factor, ECF subfamily
MRSELVARAPVGDADAFAELVHDQVDRCFALAFRILGDVHRAPDATQQALLSAWRDLPGLRDAGAFEGDMRRPAG